MQFVLVGTLIIGGCFGHYSGNDWASKSRGMRIESRSHNPVMTCQRQSPPSTTDKSGMKGALPPTVYVFYAGPEAPERLTFAFRDGELFVQSRVSQAGERVTQKRYLVSRLPPDLAEKILTWLKRSQTAQRREFWGEIKSNGPTVLTRHTLLYDSPRVHGWDDFVADDPVKELLSAVEAAAVRREFEVERLPRWVEEDSRVRDDFYRR